MSAFPFTTIIINFEHSLHALYVVVIATRYLLVDIMVVMVFSYLVSFLVSVTSSLLWVKLWQTVLLEILQEMLCNVHYTCNHTHA